MEHDNNDLPPGTWWVLAGMVLLLLLMIIADSCTGLNSMQGVAMDSQYNR